MVTKKSINIKHCWMMILLLSLGFKAAAQQVPSFSQYMFNKFILNPATAGAEGFTAYSLTSRIQWAGFKDAPVTNAISAQTRLTKNRFYLKSVRKRNINNAPEYGNIGIGFHLYNDRRGILNQTSAQFTYAYHQKIELKGQLSFGLTLNLSQFKVNSNDLKSFEPDNYLLNGKLSVFIPDFNFGMYYTSENTYLGVAISHLFQSIGRFGGYEDNNFKLVRNYNIIGGYRTYINTDFNFEPSFQLKATDQLRLQIDAGCRLYYKGQVWGGLSYRTGSAIVVTLGARYKRLYFGYAYDYSLNGLQNYSFGTSELMISLKFARNVRKYKWIERF